MKSVIKDFNEMDKRLPSYWYHRVVRKKYHIGNIQNVAEHQTHYQNLNFSDENDK